MSTGGGATVPDTLCTSCPASSIYKKTSPIFQTDKLITKPIHRNGRSRNQSWTWFIWFCKEQEHSRVCGYIAQSRFPARGNFVKNEAATANLCFISSEGWTCSYLDFFRKIDMFLSWFHQNDEHVPIFISLERWIRSKKYWFPQKDGQVPFRISSDGWTCSYLDFVRRMNVYRTEY